MLDAAALECIRKQRALLAHDS